jgi:hypothetical protein
VINYIAAYTFNTSTATWSIDPTSSFNTDARFPAYDLMQPYGGIGATTTRLLHSLFTRRLAWLPKMPAAILAAVQVARSLQFSAHSLQEEIRRGWHPSLEVACSGV